MIAVLLFLVVLWNCLQFVIVVLPDHTHLLFFIREGSRSLPCNEKHSIFTSVQTYTFWSSQNVCEGLNYLLDAIFGSLLRQLVGTPVGTYCASFILNMFSI